MAAKVLDSWALMAFFKGEAAGEAVEAYLRKAADDKTRLLLCVVNWGEVYYGMWRAGGKEAAESVAEDLSRLPVELVEADLALSKQAAISRPRTGCPTPIVLPPHWPRKKTVNS